MDSMESQFTDNSVQLVPKCRSGRLELREGYDPGVSTETGSLEYLGRTTGFPMNMSFVSCDPWVRQAIIALYGHMPKELKGWSRSGATLSRVKQALSKYDRVRPGLPQGDAAFQMAVELAFNAFKLPSKLKPKKLTDVDLELNASAGWSWLGMKKRDVLSSAIVEAEKYQRLIAQRKLAKRYLPPCVSYKRTQLALLTKPKVRMVWGYPVEITLLEGKYAQPLIDEYSVRDAPMFIGRTILKELPMFMDSLFWYGGGVGLDMSSFDAAASAGMIHLAFKVLKQNLELSEQAEKELRFVEDYFINTPVVTSDGDVFIKHGGVPSGSFFTQLIDSVINFIIIAYLQFRTFGDMWTRIKVLGDDSVFSVPRGVKIDLAKWAVIAQEKFGMQINVAKSFIADKPRDLEFLGHASFLGRVWRDPVKLHLLALYPEYGVPDAATSVARVQGILVDSGFQSHSILALYKIMLELYGQPGELKRDKSIRYVIQRRFPINRRVELHELEAVS